MNILFDHVVLFHSNPEFYNKERSGLKRNTVRLIGPADDFPQDKLTHIRISNQDSSDFFTRKISDISEVAELLGKKVFVFSWDSDKGA